MLKFLWYMVDNKADNLVLTVYVASMVMTVIVASICCHIFGGKKVTNKSWFALWGVILGFIAINFLCISDLAHETIPVDKIAQIEPVLAMMLKINIMVPIATLPLVATTYFVRCVRKSFIKARKAAKRRRQEEYYQ